MGMGELDGRSGTPETTETHATCSSCGVYAERARPYRRRCKKCYGEENRERSRRWNRENAERHRASAKKWKSENLEKAKESGRRWRVDNKSRVRRNQKAWLDRNPEVKVDNKTKRRHRKREAFKEPLPRGWISAQRKRQGGKCSGCAQRFNKRRKATVDHIVPLARGGKHEPTNCQLLCLSCNTTKQAMLEEEFQRRQFGRLL